MTTEVMFQKRTVAELTENEMVMVDGGTSYGCVAAGAAAGAVAIATVLVVIEIAEKGYAFGQWLASR